MEPISLPTLETCFSRTRGVTAYHMGAKPAPDADSHAVPESDCSGYSRWLVAKSTGQKVILPQGSVEQREWCESQGLHRLARYSDVQYAAADDSRLFMAFLDPHGDHAGHVILVLGGFSRECCGSLGAASRAWNHPHLAGMQHCFELPAVT